MEFNDSINYPQRSSRHRRKSKTKKLLLTILLITIALITMAFIPSTSETLYYLNGNIKYSGVRDTLSSGTGSYYYNDGSPFYKGQWLDGYAHGQGEYYLANGTLVYSGQWEDGVINGYGTQYYPDGTIMYEGNWQLGHYHGEGTKYIQHEELGHIKIYSGHWESGTPSGTGEIFDHQGNLIYKGEIENGMRHGQGNEYILGTLHYSGPWIDDQVKDYSNFYLPQGEQLPASLGQYYSELVNIQGYNEAVRIASSLLPHSHIIEGASDDTYFKYLMYQYLEFPPNYNNRVVIDIIQELESIPTTIIEDLVQLEVKHRLINGSIANQPEFRNTSESMRGISLTDALGIASTQNRLLITRLDRGNPTNTTIHELGHGVDFFLLGGYSQTDTFKEIWKEEASSMFSNRIINTNYYIDYPEEYFAEFFNQYFISDSKKLLGGARNNAQIQQRAPKTYQYFTDNVLNYQSKHYLEKPSNVAIANPLANFTFTTTPADPLHLEQSHSILINLIGRIKSLTN